MTRVWCEDFWRAALMQPQIPQGGVLNAGTDAEWQQDLIHP